jgi:hypothetical protein
MEERNKERKPWDGVLMKKIQGPKISNVDCKWDASTSKILFYSNDCLRSSSCTQNSKSALISSNELAS